MKESKNRSPVLLLTYKEAGEAISLSECTVAGMVKDGHIPYVQYGSSKRIDPRDIIAWIDASKRRNETAAERTAREVEELRLLNDLALIEEREAAK